MVILPRKKGTWTEKWWISKNIKLCSYKKDEAIW